MVRHRSRIQMPIMFRASLFVPACHDRALVERPAYLDRACGADRMVRKMEIEACGSQGRNPCGDLIMTPYFWIASLLRP